MRTPRRRSLLSLLDVALTLALAGPASADIRFQAIGKPTWKPTDWHQFTAGIGTFDNDFADFYANEALILPEPNHTRVPGLGIGPGAPHAGPYESEIGRGIRAAGFRRSSGFDLDEFSNGNGVWTALMLVPRPGRAARGATPDSPNGPMIANDRFPIHVGGSVEHRGARYGFSEFDVPPLDATIDERFAGVEGHSHFPIFLADAAEFYSEDVDPTGPWLWRVTFLDQYNEGWQMTVRFIVRPE